MEKAVYTLRRRSVIRRLERGIATRPPLSISLDAAEEIMRRQSLRGLVLSHPVRWMGRRVTEHPLIPLIFKDGAYDLSSRIFLEARGMRRTALKRRSTHPANVALRKKKAKALTITKLKDKLWQECRRIVINRYGNDCYTCPARDLSGSNLHTGHFITSSICSTGLRYDLRNLRPQCYRCNIHLSGNWPSYEAHLIRDGVDVEALKRRNQETKGKLYGRQWILDTIRDYEQLV